MPAVISLTLGFIRGRAAQLVGVGVLVAALGGGYLYVSRLHAQVDAAESLAANATAAAAAAEAALARAQRDHARAVAALEAERAAAEKRSAELREARRKVEAAPEADDGPVAPVLRDALEALRGGGGGDA
jgi:F0F1-type ATP synthase epsilon subunit